MGSLADLRFLFPLSADNLEPTEAHGNFYFVKNYDEELYSKLHKAEGLAKTDIVGCGKNLRDVLEYFFHKILTLPENQEMMRFTDENDPFHENHMSLIDCCVIAQKHPGLGINAELASRIRSICNIAAHIESKDRSQYFEFSIICEALRLFRQMVGEYFAYTNKKEILEILENKYDEDYQPINDCIVYAVETGDELSFEKKYFCYRDTGAFRDYYVIKQYTSLSLRPNQKREIETLNTVWHRVKTPRGIVGFEFFESKEGSDLNIDKKTFIVYKMNGQPHKLNPVIIRDWTKYQKYEVLYLLADALSSIHDSKIYHRNITPDSIYTYNSEDEIGIYLFDFELSKIGESTFTVVSSMKSNIDIHSIFIAPEVENNLDNNPFNIEWEKSDIYSLGILFAYILLDGTLNDGVHSLEIANILNRLSDEHPIELTMLIESMCSVNINNRPNTEQIKQVLSTIIKSY